MRRILFTALILIGLCLSASAQKEEMHYYSDSKGSSWVIREFIDRSAKMYYFDGDSEKDCTMEMKNYKKSGNTETFDIYYYMGYEKGKKRGSITIVTDPDLDIKAKELDLSKQTVTIKDGTHTFKYYFLTGKQEKIYNKMNGNGGASDDGGNAIDKAKDKAKGLLNKGKNLFKKKK